MHSASMVLGIGCLLAMEGCTTRSNHASPRGDASDAAPVKAVSALPPGRWYPPNRDHLNTWIQTLAGSQHASARTAVFDWDNTSVFGDVEETLFQYQLDHLAFKLTAEHLSLLLPESANGVEVLAGGVRLADVRADVLAAYEALKPLLAHGDLAAARHLPAHEDFRAKVGWLYEALAGTPGIGERYAYSWVAYWLADMSAEQVSALAREAFTDATQGPIEKRTWQSRSAGRAGQLTYSFMHGLRAQPEIKDLMTALKSAGVHVYVVSASPEVVVETAARRLEYPVDAAHIYGVRLASEHGRLLPKLVSERDYPFTYRPGKAELIRKLLPGSPVFMAGDSDTDFEMLTGFDSLEYRLVINRNKKSDIHKLYEEALQPAPATGSVRTILQGRDDNTGFFQPLMETTPLGATAPKPLR